MEDIEKWELANQIKLKSITWAKCHGSDHLTGIQFNFTHGISSPLLGGKDAEGNVKGTVDVDMKKEIRKIRTRHYLGGHEGGRHIGATERLQMVDETGSVAVDIMFSDK